MNTIREDQNALPKQTMKYIMGRTVSAAKVAGLSYEDEDDLRQTLFLAAVKARAKYDATHKASIETFLHCAVDNALKNFLRDRRRIKRVNLICVLDAKECDEGFELGDDEENDETMAERIPDETGSGIPETDLKLDVAEGVRRLDPTSRRLCELIMSGMSVREAGREMGIPFWTLNRKYVPAIARHLRNFLAS